MSAAGFQTADRGVRCCDMWPLAKVRESAMAAYKRLEEQGTIQIHYPLKAVNGRLEIVYDAQVPHEWMLDALRKAETEILGESSQVGMVLDAESR